MKSHNHATSVTTHVDLINHQARLSSTKRYHVNIRSNNKEIFYHQLHWQTRRFTESSKFAN